MHLQTVSTKIRLFMRKSSEYQGSYCLPVMLSIPKIIIHCKWLDRNGKMFFCTRRQLYILIFSHENYMYLDAEALVCIHGNYWVYSPFTKLTCTLDSDSMHIWSWKLKNLSTGMHTDPFAKGVQLKKQEQAPTDKEGKNISDRVVSLANVFKIMSWQSELFQTNIYDYWYLLCHTKS